MTTAPGAGASPGAQRPSPWRSRFAQRTYVAGVFWTAGIVLSAVGNQPDVAGLLRVRLDAAGIAYFAAAAIGGTNFFGAGLRALVRLWLDMNFLMSAAIVAAILVGESFEAATIACLFSAAELLERFAVDRGRRALSQLLSLAPDRAERLLPDGGTEQVNAVDLRIGNLVRVRPGDRIPADGRVVSGRSTVNEANITGESLPRERGPGDPVFAGTVNGDGSLDLEVTADPGHSTLARIVTIVKEAEARRAPIEQFVQRFARVYTPAVTISAILVMTVPPLAAGMPALEWFLRGVTLLVIACPCALVIATPVTVVSALTSAARYGVLIKGGTYLETLGGMRALAVDKTGTLTRGELAVTDWKYQGSGSAQDFLCQLASLESRSEHAAARAITRFAADRGVGADRPVESFLAAPGRGITGQVDGDRIVAGTEELVGSEVASRFPPPEPGTLLVYVVADSNRFAALEMRDEIRPHSAAFVCGLKASGLQHLVMLTGDAGASAGVVASAVGITEVRARLLPEEKVFAVRELRARYRTVGMLGDGVNDAAALAEASVGIAMGGAGSPATLETADIVLMGDDLMKLPYAIHLARLSRRTIRFNISLALVTKALLAAGAVAGMVSLAVAVLVGDLGSSLVVTLNALRVAQVKPGTR